MFSCGLDKQVKCWDMEYNKVQFFFTRNSIHTTAAYEQLMMKA